jgi:hypothetical protein
MRLGVVGRNWPRLGAVTGLHEKFVEREFDCWADDVERIRSRERVTDAFTVVHLVREGGSGKEKGRGTKVGRKERGEAKKGIVGTSSGCGNGGGRSYPVGLAPEKCMQKPWAPRRIERDV